jgi:hypothetical protein
MNLSSFRNMLKVTKAANKKRVCALFLNTPTANFGVKTTSSLVNKNAYNFAEKK